VLSVIGVLLAHLCVTGDGRLNSVISICTVCGTSTLYVTPIKTFVSPKKSSFVVKLIRCKTR
jgi:hypothetical protein